MFQIPKSWILLDTCSTCNVSNNPTLVTDIRECSSAESLTAHTNGGLQKYEHVANLKLLPVVVHFKDDLMATIPSLKTVSELEGSRLTMDTAVDKSITLTMKNGDNYIFKMYENGLYFSIQITQIISLTINLSYSTTHFLQTVTDNKTFFQSRKSKERILHEKYKSIYSILAPKL